MSDEKKFKISKSAAERAAWAALSVVEKRSGVTIERRGRELLRKRIKAALEELSLEGNELVHPECPVERPGPIFTIGFPGKPIARRRWKEPVEAA